MKKILLIANEKSGTGRVRYQLINIITSFMEAGWEVQVYPIAPAKGFTAEKVLAGDLSSYEKVVVAGGDGTLSHVIQALMQRQDRPVIGYIPGGSTNDFARSLEIPTSANGAVRTILTGREFAYDIGGFQDTWFNYIAAFGAFVPVSFQTGQRAKNTFGRGAYILEGIASFQENISFSCPMQVTWKEEEDGEEKSETGDFLFGAVFNSTSIGGLHLHNVTRDDLQDGKLNLLLIRHPHSAEERRQLVQDVRSDVHDGEYLTVTHVTTVHFHAEQPTLWTLDGEDGGQHDDVKIHVAPQAMKIMIPKEKIIKGK